MPSPIARFLLGWCNWAWLIQSGNGLIQVYSLYRQYDATVFWVPVYYIPNNYQAIAGHGSSTPSYLQVASPENACNAEYVGSAPEVWENNRLVPFILLTNNAPCSPQSGNRNTADSDDSGVTVKLINAQNRGYSGIIIYAHISKERAFPSGSGPIPPRTTPFPVPIPAHIADRIHIAVHFVGHDYGLQLVQYGYNPFARTRYRMSVSSVVNDLSSSSGSRYPMQYPKDENFRPTTTSSPYPSDSSSLSDGIAMITIFGVFTVVIVCVPLWWCCCGCPKCRIRLSADRAAEQPTNPQVAAHPTSGEEMAGVAADPERTDHQYTEAPVVPVQLPAGGVPLHTDDTPLTQMQMQQLTPVKVTHECDDVCPTCQQTFAVDEIKVILPCFHVGHAACLTTWLTTYSRNCPVCRQPVVTELTAELSPADIIHPVALSPDLLNYIAGLDYIDYHDLV
ncbi:uncharacterized protein LOC129600962 isoform X1 [Paramacrobiotus metropolitanus]|uniref:uncharacterized protein LOC129600962 isoform X1 n=1 Tax=Paramacrobiotus metropolitanus TaxID=2943436 RepID=UPI002445D2A2|nr:uncharacterized protein LOC129600962 isoform X1 [Paramacrobiotus metropolitanus]